MSGADPRYGPEVRRRMENLPGLGAFPPDPGLATGCAGDREQGAEVVLQCRVAGGRAVELRFQAFGCPHLLAAASWLTDRLQGATAAELEHWDWREAAAALEVPPAKYGRLLTLQDAVRAVARNWPAVPASTV